MICKSVCQSWVDASPNSPSCICLSVFIDNVPHQWPASYEDMILRSVSFSDFSCETVTNKMPTMNETCIHH